jgi:hypothetical protein
MCVIGSVVPESSFSDNMLEEQNTHNFSQAGAKH